MRNLCLFKMIPQLKLCLATFDMNVFCFNVLRVTANMSGSLLNLGATLDCTNPPLSLLMAPAKAVMLIFQ